MATTPSKTSDPYSGYGPVSVVLHWLTAIAVVVLFLTHDQQFSAIHLGIGLAFAPIFLFRVYWRLARGYPRVAEQPPIFNFAARLVMLCFLASVLVVTVTGLLMPALEGEPYAFFGLFSFSVPLPVGRGTAQIWEEIHDFAGHAFLPLAALHILGALHHRIAGKDDIVRRMLRPVRGGK